MGNASCFGRGKKEDPDIDQKENLISKIPKSDFFCLSSIAAEKLGQGDQTRNDCNVWNDKQIGEFLEYLQAFYKNEIKNEFKPVTDKDRKEFYMMVEKVWEAMLTYRHLKDCALVDEQGSVEIARNNLVDILEWFILTLRLIHEKYIFNPAMQPRQKPARRTREPAQIALLASHTPKFSTVIQHVQPPSHLPTQVVVSTASELSMPDKRSFKTRKIIPG